MATLGTIDLGYTEQDVGNGAAFTLTSPSSQTLTHTVGNQGIVCLEQGNPYAIVKMPSSGRSPDQVLSGFRPLLEQALDELSVTAHLNLAIRSELQEYLVWWTDNAGKRVIRYVSVTCKAIQLRTHVKVTRADGSLGYESCDIPVINGSSLSLSYYRRSRISTEVFEAFRDMYLALEDELSVMHPKQQGESETAWIKRAIAGFVKTCPHGVLSTVCGQQSQESWFMTNVYKGVRIKVFHAKDGLDKLVPGSSRDEAVPKAMLPVVTRMVEESWAARKLVDFPGMGVITNDGFQIWTRHISENYKLAVAGYRGDELPYDSEARVRTDVISMESNPIVRNHAPWLAGAEGSCPVSAISVTLPLQHVLITDEGKVVMDVRLDAPLDLAGFDEFEAQVAIELRNGES